MSFDSSPKMRGLGVCAEVELPETSDLRTKPGHDLIYITDRCSTRDGKHGLGRMKPVLRRLNEVRKLGHSMGGKAQGERRERKSSASRVSFFACKSQDGVDLSARESRIPRNHALKPGL